MKRLFAFVLSAVMVISCTMMPAVAVEANSKNDNTSPTRDYMQLQHTETVCYNSNSVSITVFYGVREDFSNSSGYRIVAIGGCGVGTYSGWVYVDRAEVVVSGISYRDNNQIADVPIKYYASTGSGTVPYTAIITIDLNT